MPRFGLKQVIFAGVGAVLAVSASVASAEKISLKIASGHSSGWLFVQITQNYFIPEVKKRVKERTNHEVEFTEGFAGSMVKANEVLEGVQSGIIDIGAFCICHEGQKLALHNFMMYLPFGPSDPAVSVKATRKVYDSIPEFNQILEKTYGQKQLALIPFDPYLIISRVPIKGPADMKGLKVGAAGPNLFWVESLGSRPLSITGPDVYTGFQSGLMDSNVTFASIMDSLKLYDVAPYVIKVGFGAMSTPAIHMNLRRLNKLPKEVRDIIIEVGRDTEAYAGKATLEAVQRYDSIILKGGGTIIDMDQSARQAWAEALKALPGQIGKQMDRDHKIPLTRAMKAYVAATEAEGFHWPVRYPID